MQHPDHEQQAKQHMQMIIFLSIVLVVGILMHWAVIAFFSMPLLVNIIISILGMNSIMSLALIHKYYNKYTKIAYLIGVCWMGILLISVIVIAPLAILSLIFPIHTTLFAAIAIISLCCLGAYNALIPSVKHINIKVQKPLARPIKIVQLSDIHLGEIYGKNFLRKVVQMTNKLEPEVVVITGDLFDGLKIYDDIARPIEQLSAPALFITGNHEVYGGEDTAQYLKKIKLTMLDNASTVLHGVQFVGIAYGSNTLLTADADKPVVMLRHLPENPEQAMAAGYDLQLSGHTHHGQIWPISYLVRIQFPVISGMYQKGNFVMYVSSGVGTWGPPFRIGSRSEITCITLEGI